MGLPSNQVLFTPSHLLHDIAVLLLAIVVGSD